MLENKKDKLSLFTYDPDSIATHPMNQNQGITDTLTPLLTQKDVVSVMCTMKSNYLFYQPILEKKKKVEKALTYVVQGDVISLIDLIKANLMQYPSLVFEKYAEITAPRGQTYYNVSAYQLMTFLCDADQKKQTMSLIPEQYNAIRKAQYAEIDCGGADSIKLDRNPIDILRNHGFEEVIQYKKTYDCYDDTSKEITHPLLENPDGIICYQNEDKEKQFFYVNKNNQSIQSLDITEESEALKRLKKSFDDMENNASRRSSEEEYQLIATVLKISLVRKGILYKDNGIFYRDSRTPFNIINGYRKCLRVFEEVSRSGDWMKGHQSWRNDIGNAQGEEIWLLQRLCEKNKPFYPLQPENFATFNRKTCVVYNSGQNREEDVFKDGVIRIAGFALFKAKVYTGREHVHMAVRTLWLDYTSAPSRDFGALCWLIEDAKANVIDFKLEQEEQVHCTIR